jgi:hypothetical protein
MVALAAIALTISSAASVDRTSYIERVIAIVICFLNADVNFFILCQFLLFSLPTIYRYIPIR